MRSFFAFAVVVALSSTAAAGPAPEPEGWNGYATAEDCAPADVAPALHVATIMSLDWASDRDRDRISRIDLAGTRRGAARATWVLADAAIRVMLPIALDADGEPRAAARIRGIAPITSARTARRAARVLASIDVAPIDVANLGRAIEQIADDPTTDCEENGAETSLLGDLAGHAIDAGVSHRRVAAIVTTAIARAAASARRSR